jgi:hypothetical protein
VAKWFGRPLTWWPSGLAGRLSKLVHLANQMTASEMAEFLRSRCFKSANKGAKGAKRDWLALLEAGFPFFEPTWLTPGSSKPSAR